MSTLTLTELGWTFNVELDDATGAPPPGGLVFKQVRHDGHNFAKDIRFLGIYISVEQVDATGKVLSTQNKFVDLNSASFKASMVRTLKPKTVKRPVFSGTFNYLQEVDSALNFSDYFKDGTGNYVATGLAVLYQGPTLFKDLHLNNCEWTGLTIDQTYLFSRYANDPPHEPSGALMAARFHPLVSYKLVPDQTCDRSQPYYRMKSIRFDYRLNLYLDTMLQDKTTNGLNKNQAGLFADTDIGSLRAFGRKVTFRGTSKISFYAVEKPAVREVATYGLIDGESKGKPPGSNDDIVCWDNIHWWGANAPGQPMISTPGAFHAAHTHWRWGALLKSWLGRAKATEWKRFQPGDALLDPRIPLQTLQIALTKYRSTQDPDQAKLQDLCKEQWDTLFHNKSNSPQPDSIKDGADLVLWYSAEVHPNVFQMPPAGTVFLHGVFFAHESEQDGSTVGSRDPLYWPRDEDDIDKAKQWFRPAND
jgi:hypothetical protein